MRYAGIKNNKIALISETSFDNSDLKNIAVPSTFDHISSLDLMTYGHMKGDKISYKLERKPAKEMKVALVGNWKMQCGIATYSESLWPEIVKHVGDYKLFIEKNSHPTGDIFQIGNEVISENKVSECWKRGDSLIELVNEIKNYDPDVVIFSHEFGLWPNAAHWSSAMTQLSDYRVIVIMHSVFPNHKDKTVIEACIPEIVVHLDEAKNALIKKGISAPIHVIPHGCYPHSDERLWNIYKTEHTIIQMGFGFKYKAFEETILACSILKEKYSDLLLTIIFSESDQNKSEHQNYYNELKDLIHSLHLEENVSIVRGFQSDEVINAYLRTHKISVFPYKSNPEHLVFGASGAARLAMTANLPVISSTIPHFSDLPTIKCSSVEEIAQEIDKLFSNSSYYKNQIQEQFSFIKENSWENVSLKFIAMLEQNY